MIQQKDLAKGFCKTSALLADVNYTVKMNMLYLINRIVATDYKQYY